MASAGLLLAFDASAQSTPRIGYLSLGAEVSPQAAFRTAFLSGMAELGYAGNRAPTMIYQYAEGRPERLSGLATMLVQSKPDVLVGEGQQASFALKAATTSIPTVTLSCDAVARGLVPQLARPGGNLTGVSCLTSELTVKRVQLLRELRPAMKRIAILWNSHDPTKVKEVEMAGDAADRLGIAHLSYEVRTQAEIDASFIRMRAEGIDGVLLVGDSFMILNRQRIVAAVADLRLPAVYPFREFVDAGGLLCYGPNLPAMFRSLAGYVDRILKGAAPGTLPVAQPTVFDFAINLPASRAIGTEIPRALLAQASAVIE